MSRGYAGAMFVLMNLLFACDDSMTRDTDASLAIGRAVAEARLTDSRIVELGNALPFAWDTLLVIGPYTPLETLDARLRVDQRVSRSGIELRDDIVLLVFLSSGTVVDVAEVARNDADFSPLADERLAPADRLRVDEASVQLSRVR